MRLVLAFALAALAPMYAAAQNAGAWNSPNCAEIQPGTLEAALAACDGPRATPAQHASLADQTLGPWAPDQNEAVQVDDVQEPETGFVETLAQPTVADVSAAESAAAPLYVAGGVTTAHLAATLHRLAQGGTGHYWLRDAAFSGSTNGRAEYEGSKDKKLKAKFKKAKHAGRGKWHKKGKRK